MLAADRTTFDDRDARTAATAVETGQSRQIREAIAKLEAAGGAAFSNVVISGSGEFLARRSVEDLGMRIISLSDVLGKDFSTVAPAYALWCLAGEAQKDAPPPETPET